MEDDPPEDVFPEDAFWEDVPLEEFPPELPFPEVVSAASPPWPKKSVIINTSFKFSISAAGLTTAYTDAPWDSGFTSSTVPITKPLGKIPLTPVVTMVSPLAIPVSRSRYCSFQYPFCDSAASPVKTPVSLLCTP